MIKTSTLLVFIRKKILELSTHTPLRVFFHTPLESSYPYVHIESEKGQMHEESCSLYFNIHLFFEKDSDLNMETINDHLSEILEHTFILEKKDLHIPETHEEQTQKTEPENDQTFTEKDSLGGLFSLKQLSEKKEWLSHTVKKITLGYQGFFRPTFNHKPR